MKLKNLTNKEKKESKELLKIYKFVSRCDKCKDIYGHDKEKDTSLCYFCDPKSPKRFKNKHE